MVLLTEKQLKGAAESITAVQIRIAEGGDTTIRLTKQQEGGEPIVVGLQTSDNLKERTFRSVPSAIRVVRKTLPDHRVFTIHIDQQDQ